MANLIDADVLKADSDLPDPTDIWNGIWNLYCSYYTVHGVFPKYLYVNRDLWENHLAKFMWYEVMELGLKVIDSPFMPPQRVSLHQKEYPHREIAKWHKDFSDEEGELSGRLSIE